MLVEQLGHEGLQHPLHERFVPRVVPRRQVVRQLVPAMPKPPAGVGRQRFNAAFERASAHASVTSQKLVTSGAHTEGTRPCASGCWCSRAKAPSENQSAPSELKAKIVMEGRGAS